MATSRVALPPGQYYISATNYSNLWLTTKSSAKPLQLDGPNTKQLWKVTGDGQLIYPSNDYSAYSFTPAPDVTVNGDRASAPVCGTWSTWTINVVDNKDGSFKGYIMSSNDAIVYWAVDGDGQTIVLKKDKVEWVFSVL